MKKVVRSVPFIVLLVILFVFGMGVRQNLIARHVVEGVRSRTGATIKFSEFEKGIFAPTLKARDLKVYDSPQNGGALLLDMPELFIEYDSEAWSRGKIHLTRMDVHVNQVNFTATPEWTEVVQKLFRQSIPKKSKKSFEQIDHLTISLGSLRVRAADPETRTVDILMGFKNESFKNVRSSKDLKPLVRKVTSQNSFRDLRRAYKIWSDFKKDVDFTRITETSPPATVADSKG